MFDLPLDDRLLEAVALAYIALSRLPEPKRSASDLKALRQVLDETCRPTRHGMSRSCRCV